MAHAMMTTTVPWITCDWVGHSTFFSSAMHSLMKCWKPPRPRTRLGLRHLRSRAHCLLTGARALADALLLLAVLSAAALAPSLPRIPGHATRPRYVELPYGFQA